MQKTSFKLALCQCLVEDDKHKNLLEAKAKIVEASNYADVIVLPEMFNCPYRTSRFRAFAENEEDSESLNMISKLAGELQKYIVAGSIPERDGNRYYNTSYVFDREGNMIGKHRKMHLYDIDIKNLMRVKESDVFSPGNDVTVIDTEYGAIGLAICYDIRFPEIFRMMVDRGAKIVIAPAAFNMISGPAHWDTLLKSRATDNQVYFAAISPARNENEKYVIYGHSKVSDPYGNVVGELDEKEGILYVDINLDYVDEVRNMLPLLEHRRKDIYEVKEKY